MFVCQRYQRNIAKNPAYVILFTTQATLFYILQTTWFPPRCKQFMEYSKQQQLENYNEGMWLKAFNRQQRRHCGGCSVFQSVKKQFSYLLHPPLKPNLPQAALRFWHGIPQPHTRGLQQLTTAFCHWVLTSLQNDIFSSPPENRTWLCCWALLTETKRATKAAGLKKA